jgi:hypothetical protein
MRDGGNVEQMAQQRVRRTIGVLTDARLTPALPGWSIGRQ